MQTFPMFQLATYPNLSLSVPSPFSLLTLLSLFCSPRKLLYCLFQIRLPFRRDQTTNYFLPIWNSSLLLFLFLLFPLPFLPFLSLLISFSLSSSFFVNQRHFPLRFRLIYNRGSKYLTALAT